MFHVLSLPHYGFSLYTDQLRLHEIFSSKKENLRTLKLKHGDKIYFLPRDCNNLWEIPSQFYQDVDYTHGSDSLSVVSEPEFIPSLPLNGKKSSGSTNQVEEDEVDKQLWKLDGKIKRLKDKK